MKRVGAFKPDALVVSLGADTFRTTRLDSSFWAMTTIDDYSDMGQRIVGPGLPSMVVMEDGYAVDDLGINTVSFIRVLA